MPPSAQGNRTPGRNPPSGGRPLRDRDEPIRDSKPPASGDQLSKSSRSSAPANGGSHSSPGKAVDIQGTSSGGSKSVSQSDARDHDRSLPSRSKASANGSSYSSSINAVDIQGTSSGGSKSASRSDEHEQVRSAPDGRLKGKDGEAVKFREASNVPTLGLVACSSSKAQVSSSAKSPHQSTSKEINNTAAKNGGTSTTLSPSPCQLRTNFALPLNAEYSVTYPPINMHKLMHQFGMSEWQ